MLFKSWGTFELSINSYPACLTMSLQRRRPYALHCFVYYGFQKRLFPAAGHMEQSVGTARAGKSDPKIDLCVSFFDSENS